jgi:hypothetical protein
LLESRPSWLQGQPYYIEASFDGIRHAISKIDLELDVRVLPHEAVQRRRSRNRTPAAVRVMVRVLQ